MNRMRLSPQAFVRIAKALSDPQRLEILEMAARAGEIPCTVLCGRCAVSQATVSHHLKELVSAGLLERRKTGQYAWYSYRSETMEAYRETLSRRLIRVRPKRATRYDRA
jgi:ArsR family transcriptional regulator